MSGHTREQLATQTISNLVTESLRWHKSTCTGSCFVRFLTKITSAINCFHRTHLWGLHHLVYHFPLSTLESSLLAFFERTVSFTFHITHLCGTIRPCGFAILFLGVLFPSRLQGLRGVHILDTMYVAGLLLGLKYRNDTRILEMPGHI
jgi:hypothetical protein